VSSSASEKVARAILIQSSGWNDRLPDGADQV
jgi:hypothetical protein